MCLTNGTSPFRPWQAQQRRPARPSNHHSLLGFQKCIRGRPSQDHKRDNLEHEDSGTGRPSKDLEPHKMERQNFVRGTPSQDHKRDNLEQENSVAGRPSKDHEPHEMELQDFVRGRPCQDHKPGNLRCVILSLAGPAKTMSRPWQAPSRPQT